MVMLQRIKGGSQTKTMAGVDIYVEEVQPKLAARSKRWFCTMVSGDMVRWRSEGSRTDLRSAI